MSLHDRRVGAAFRRRALVTACVTTIVSCGGGSSTEPAVQGPPANKVSLLPVSGLWIGEINAGPTDVALVGVLMKEAAAVDDVAGTATYSFVDRTLVACSANWHLVDVTGTSHNFSERLRNTGACSAAGRIELVRTADSLSFTRYAPNGAASHKGVLKRPS